MLRRFAVALLAFACTAAQGTAVEHDDPWFAQGRAAVERARALRPDAGLARNVILFVGDGMNLPTVAAARILEGQEAGGSGEEHQLSFEALPYVALAKTYNTDRQVPDSAGTMTAMVTGVKTKAGILSLDDRAELGNAASALSTEVPTLCERAEARGMSTGVVTTTRVTHATAAACFVHTPQRDWEADTDIPDSERGVADIARQLVEFSAGDGIDVLLGGGAARFVPADAGGRRGDGRDLVAAWRERPDAVVVKDRGELLALDPATDRGPLLGLFAPSHMAFEADRDVTGEPSLSEMTAAAIDHLEAREDGYVLIVEGGRIDHAHHLGNAQRALRDTVEFSNAVRVALDRVERDRTLILVTADHGHVFTLGGYPRRGNDILGYVMTPSESGDAEPALDLRGEPYPTLVYANGPGAGAQPPDGPRAALRAELAAGVAAGSADALPPEHLDYRQPAAVPLALETHSGEDVPIYAGGPGAALFHGVQEQHFVYHAIVEALGWNAE